MLQKIYSKPQRGETLVSPLGAVALRTLYRGVLQCYTPYFLPKTMCYTKARFSKLAATTATP